MSTTLPAQRSTFVTVLAWIFIVLSGFSTLIALMQNAMLWFVFEGAPGVGDAMSKANQAPGIPPFFGYFFRYFPVIFAAFLLLSATTLASSIGLLLRQEWARRLFIALMAFGIAWNFAGLAFQALFLMNMPPMPPLPPAQQHFASGFHWIMGLMLVFNLLIAIGFSVLFYWIIRRLRTPEIRREFQPAS